MTYPSILQTAEQFFYATYLSSGGAYYFSKLAEVASMPDWLNATFYGSFLAYVACKLPAVIVKLIGDSMAKLRHGWKTLRQLFGYK